MPRMTWTEEEVETAIRLAYSAAIRSALLHFQREEMQTVEQCSVLIDFFMQKKELTETIAYVKRTIPLMTGRVV